MSDGYGITPENMLRTLPYILQNDESIRALAASIAEILAKRTQEIDLLRIYARIDELPEEMLDILAYDFKVDWWDENYTLEEKRQTLKNSRSVYRTLGTKSAAKKAISAVYRNTEISEWFEYAGDPYGFKFLIDTTYDSVDPEKHKRVMERADYYKNLRSHLDGIDYIARPQGKCTAYAATAAVGMEIKITTEVQVHGLE